MRLDTTRKGGLTTQLSLIRATTALAGVLLSVCAAAAQAVTAPSLEADLRETGVRLLRHDVLPSSGLSVIRPAVAPPSSDFTTYTEGELVRVSIPSNWRELPASNGVTFAPEGAYRNVGVKSVFTHGFGMGLARNDQRDLRITTDDFINAYVLATPRPRDTFQYGWVMIADRPGLHTVLSSVSEATGEPEQIDMVTTLLRDGTLFYVVAVVPLDSASDYEGTFRQVMRSIQIMDCDQCVR